MEECFRCQGEFARYELCKHAGYYFCEDCMEAVLEEDDMPNKELSVQVPKGDF